MAVEFEPLVFEIKQGSNDAAKGVDALVQSLGKLKAVTGQMSALSHTASSLKKLNNTLNGFRAETLTKLASALETLNRVQDIRIPQSLSRNIAAVSGALTIIKPEHIELLNKLSDAISNLKNVQDITLQRSLGDRIRSIAEGLNYLTEDGISRFERLTAGLQQIGQMGNVRIPNVNIQGQNASRLPTVPRDSGIQQSTGITEARSRIDAARSSIAEVRSHMEQVRASTAAAVQQIEMFSQVLSGISQAASIAATAIRIIVRVVRVVINVLKRAAEILRTVITQAGRLAASVGKVLMNPFVKLGGSISKSVKGLGQFFSSLKRIAMYRLIRSAIAAITQGISTGIQNLYQYSKLAKTQFAESMDKIATSALYVKNSLAAMVSPIYNAIAPAIDMIADKFVTVLNKINQVFASLFGQKTYTAARKIEAEFAKIKSHLIGIDELNVIDDDQPPVNEMFEELPIDTDISNFVDRLKKIFEDADWETLGRMLGDKINDLIEKIDWEKIGKTIGNCLDAAIKTAYYFLKEIDFQKAGAAVATLINNLLESVDWEYLGRLLVVKITSMWDFAIGFLRELDWGEVGHSIFTFIIGALHEFSEWLDEIDWVDLGETLLRKLQDFFENFDFGEVIKTISTTLGKAVKAMKDLLTPLWNSFKEWWNEHIKGKDFLETIKNLGNYLANFVNEYIVTPFFDAFLGGSKGSGNFDPTKKLMENMQSYMRGGSVDIGEMLTDIMSDADLSLIDKFKAVGQMIMYGVLYGIHEMIKDQWLLSFFVEPFLGVVCKLFGINSPAESMMPIGEYIFLGLLEGIKEKIKTIYDWIKENIVQPIGEAIGEFRENVKEVAGTIWEWITEGFHDISDTIKEIAGTIWDWITEGFHSIVDKIKEIAGTIWDWVTEGIKDIAEKIRDIAVTVWGWISEGFHKIVDKVKGLGRTVIGWVKNAFSGKKDDTGTSMGEQIVANMEDGAINGVSQFDDTSRTIVDSIYKSMTTVGNNGKISMLEELAGKIVTGLIDAMRNAMSNNLEGYDLAESLKSFS